MIFWSPTKAHQKEHSELREPRDFLFCGQLERLSGSPQGGVDWEIWQKRKIELWS